MSHSLSRWAINHQAQSPLHRCGQYGSTAVCCMPHEPAPHLHVLQPLHSCWQYNRQYKRAAKPAQPPPCKSPQRFIRGLTSPHQLGGRSAAHSSSHKTHVEHCTQSHKPFKNNLQAHISHAQASSVKKLLSNLHHLGRQVAARAATAQGIAQEEVCQSCSDVPTAKTFALVQYRSQQATNVP
jgi:hypothetical protein